MQKSGSIKKRAILSVVITTVIVITLIALSRQRPVPYHANSGMIFGTIYNISYQYDRDLKKEIEMELRRVDSSLSIFNKQSTISKINRNEQTATDSMLADVITLAEEISEQTDGAFDITVAPLVNAWGFGFKGGMFPGKAEIDSIMSAVGYKKIRLEDNNLIKEKPDIMLDCGAIAKGYGTDVIANMLRRHGIKNFMVEIGGEIVAAGISEKRQPWRIGVIKPSDDSLITNQEIQTVLNITDKAMATSGNYRNYYYKDGKKYAHTINPHTGYPVEHSLLSATVIADDCATADAYATAFMVMGQEKAAKVLEKHPELMAYLIYCDENGEYKIWHSPAMNGKLIEKENK